MRRDTGQIQTALGFHTPGSHALRLREMTLDELAQIMPLAVGQIRMPLESTAGHGDLVSSGRWPNLSTLA